MYVYREREEGKKRDKRWMNVYGLDNNTQSIGTEEDIYCTDCLVAS